MVEAAIKLIVVQAFSLLRSLPNGLELQQLEDGDVLPDSEIIVF